MHRRALEREARLKAEVQRLEALLCLREQQLFGRKTEAGAATEPMVPPSNPAASPPRRKRGQQRGRPSPKRRDHSHLPGVVEDHVLSPEQCRCSHCGQPFADFPGTEDSIILEVDVRAHRRVIRRRRYRPTCSCAAHPGIVVAPPSPNPDQARGRRRPQPPTGRPARRRPGRRTGRDPATGTGVPKCYPETVRIGPRTTPSA